MIIRARGFFLLMILLSFQHAIFGAEELKDGLYAKLETSRGEILLQLYHQRVPQTVANFVGLAEATKAWKDPISGKSKKTRFYDGLSFHRVIADFMIQGAILWEPEAEVRGTVFRMRFTRISNIPDRESSPWQTRVRIPMEVSSSSPTKQLPGWTGSIRYLEK